MAKCRKGVAPDEAQSFHVCSYSDTRSVGLFHLFGFLAYTDAVAHAADTDSNTIAHPDSVKPGQLQQSYPLICQRSDIRAQKASSLQP